MHTLARIHCTIALLLLLAVGSSIPAWILSSCCLTYHHQRPRYLLVGYYEQEIDDKCKLHAIVFPTMGGGKLCGNPSEQWVKDYMEDMDRENIAY